MRHGSLFSGIGGFDLAAEWMGWENVFHCEISEFPRKVLKYYWPKSISYADITATDFTIHRGNIDVLTGGFPCQPYSTAGKRLGKEDARHLWPEMLRAIREIRPTWIVGENVLGLANWNGGLVFHEVQTDLEAEGYKVQPYVLPAAGINAPHLRNRIWFVAKDTLGNGRILGEPDEKGTDVWEQRNPGAGDTERVRGEAMAGDTADTCGNIGREGRLHTSQSQQTESYISTRDACGQHGTNWQNFPTECPICGGDDGLPAELDGITFSKWRNESIKGYGNAVVPQVVLQIFKAIEAYEHL